MNKKKKEQKKNIKTKRLGKGTSYTGKIKFNSISRFIKNDK